MRTFLVLLKKGIGEDMTQDRGDNDQAPVTMNGKRFPHLGDKFCPKSYYVNAK